MYNNKLKKQDVGNSRVKSEFLSHLNKVVFVLLLFMTVKIFHFHHEPKPEISQKSDPVQSLAIGRHGKTDTRPQLQKAATKASNAQNEHRTVPQLKALNHLTGETGQKKKRVITTDTSASPASSSYTLYKVQSGDSLATIAYRYHVSVQSLINTNSLSSDTIYIGQKLKIPGSGGKVRILSYEPLRGKTIILSPGHGGKDAGALGNGVVEKKITLAIGKKTEADLQAQGAKVIMARTGDYFVTLSYRARLAAKYHGDIFVAIHVNKFPDPSVHGTTTYFNSTEYSGSTNPYPTQSAKLARDILDGVVEKAGMASRGARNANFVVLRENTVPSTLVETAYLSNKDEAALLKASAWQSKVASGITKGIDKYFGTK